MILTVTNVVLAALALLIPVVLWLSDRNHKRKRLSYAIDANTPLVSTASQGLGNLEVFFDKQKVEEPYLTRITIGNTGRSAITAEDQKEAITIIPRAKHTLAVLPASSSSLELVVNARVFDENVIIDPVLLNGGDSFILSLVTEGKADPIIRGRVIDVSKFEQITYTARKRLRLPLFITLMITYGIAAAGFYASISLLFQSPEVVREPNPVWDLLTLIGIALAGVFAYFMYTDKFSR